MIRISAVLLASTVGLVTLGCEEDVRSVRLKLPFDYTPRGLQCQYQPDGGLLFERLCEDTHRADGGACEADAGGQEVAALTLVVDYIDIGQGIPCDLDAFEWFCGPTDDGGATRCDVRHRDCILVELCGGELKELGCRPPTEFDLRGLLNAAHGKLSDAPVTTDAPHGTVLPRVTYVRGDADDYYCGSAEQKYTPFERGNLLGCVFGCPVSLDDIESAVILHYSAPKPCFLGDVERCANFTVRESP